MSASCWRLVDGVVLFPVGDEVLIYDEIAGKTHLVAGEVGRVILSLPTSDLSDSSSVALAEDRVEEICRSLEPEGLVMRKAGNDAC